MVHRVRRWESTGEAQEQQLPSSFPQIQTALHLPLAMPSSAEGQEGAAATHIGQTSEAAAANNEGWYAATSLLPSTQSGPRACGQFPGHILKAMFSSSEPLSHCSGLLSIGKMTPRTKGQRQQQHHKDLQEITSLVIAKLVVVP